MWARIYTYQKVFMLPEKYHKQKTHILPHRQNIGQMKNPEYQVQVFRLPEFATVRVLGLQFVCFADREYVC